ncbi:glycosyltransferase family 24 protein [Phlebiopsis gigantea 11061_1 CR5-6]|uniref:Glycosyltransferase family 24 protein n=1 Tax=Phlebiopsis gigantea (strain 11061_1 CR5-6) TaxID=745531 RepID=A0A0C3NBZ9_PHLG1|nr:glycosyltransferase family 24 protein [Phlebiopsis gigantea 11061_1 CR5-6]
MVLQRLVGPLLLVTSGILASSPPVQVELRTSWAPPPFLVELLETIAIEEPQSFFPLLEAFTDPEFSPLAQSKTDEEIYRNARQYALSAGYLSEPGELASLDMTLALHSSVPRVEAAYEYYLGSHAERDITCESWVDWYGHAVCDLEMLRALVGAETIEPSVEAFANRLPFDHVQPSPELVLDRPSRTAILYASLTSPNFRELHAYLHQASSGPAPHVEYVLRYVPPSGHIDSQERTYLSGYGVGLDLKKMEYLAVDDRRQGSNFDSSSSESFSADVYDSDPISTLLQQYPDDPTVDYTTPLTDDELLNIGLQAAQLAVDAPDALTTIRQLAQNFPRYASAIARRVVVSETVEEEIANNQAKAQGGISVVWLNGAQLSEADMNPFSLLGILRKERRIMRHITSLGLNATKAMELLTHPAVGLAQSDSGVLDGIFDASDRLEGGDVVLWWNDLENDTRYARWSPSLLSLRNLMLYPGQLPSLRLNMYNVVLVLDLSQTSALNFIAGAVAPLISRGFPFRFGLVPAVETADGAKMARLVYWLYAHVGRDRTLQFLTHVSAPESTAVEWSLIAREFLELTQHADAGPIEPKPDFHAIINAQDDATADSAPQKAALYAKRLAADLASAPLGHVFVNGKHFELNDDTVRNMQIVGGQMLQHLQEQMHYGHLSEADAPRMDTYFYDLPEASARRNRYIYPTGKTGDLRIVNWLEVPETAGVLYDNRAFVYPPTEEVTTLTVFVVADLDSEEGLELAKETLKSMTETSVTRVSFIHNPSTSTPPTTTTFSSLLGTLITKGTLSGQSEQVIVSSAATLEELLDGAPLIVPDEFISASRYLLRALRVAPGETVLVVNGRVVGPIEQGGIVAADIPSLATYELRKRVTPVVTALNDVVGPLEGYEPAELSDMIFLASSLLSSIHQPDPSEVGLFNAPIRPRRRNYKMLSGESTTFEYGDESTALFHFGVLLDPLSEAAQKWTALLEWVLNDPAVFVELHVNPARYKELPLKRFYRYNVQPSLRFTELGYEYKSKVVFNDLPEDPIYTLAMDIPPSWLVRPREASYDLDNILLTGLSASERTTGVRAVFDLDYLVIEGHAREDRTMSPPRGLQLQLVSGDGTAIADTLVVANLGYLQFRAKPGVFRLEIRPGRGREIFALESVGSEGWESATVEEAGDEVTLMSFEGLTLYPRMARLPGMDVVDVLADDTPSEDHSLVGKLKTSFSSIFSPKTTKETDVIPTNNQAEINIFTVASGLLYERFASIMILSVLRNTKSTVKFWFIENFLSPSFLEFIPHFAEAYGFQYEFVTYKWPSWLRQQKEKQRIIWAYKILFLDILFPMDLKKVIFVDADQIVRADLRELVALDLHGAPYGYTPMGDDNVEMEGFRFWKTGYWKDFLQGMPYHISALYVVDLVRFRQIAAGDILRGHYQQLSADPGSLANLDQDLPNNLQREVPIFSLPEDWLWCETWCIKDRLDRAKTIDLCQNPLTKEPKLARAKHIPEWEEYDSEIAQFARKLAESGLIHAGMADADATVLADVGAGRRVAADADAQESTEDFVTPGHILDEL